MSNERRNEQNRSRTISDDGDMSEYFKEVGTQVEEGDIISDIVRTGVAETPHVSYAQVFGTASLNTEPQITFVLPSLQSALIYQKNATESTTSSINPVITPTAELHSGLPIQPTTDHARISSTSYSVASSSAPSTLFRPEFIPKINTVPDMTSGVSAQIHHESKLPSYPHLFSPHSSIQSDVPCPRGTVAALDTGACAHSTSASQLQKSEKFLLKVSPDIRSFNNALPNASALRDQTCDVTSPENKERNEDSSTSSNPTDGVSAHVQHPLQLTENESARDNSDVGASSSSENPLTRRRASSAPSVGLEFFGRVFKRALFAQNSPETVNVALPPKRSSLETCTSSPFQTENIEIEPAQHSGRKRRRSSLGIAKERNKRRKSVAFVDDDGDSRLRERLHQRVWDGTTFKVEEVKDIDFTETALSRRGSRRESMGIIENTLNPVQGNRRRHSTAVQNARGPIAGEEVPLTRDPTSQIRESEKRPEETGETSHQCNATEEMSADEFAGETSPAQNEATSKSTENCSRSDNGDDCFYIS